MTSRDGFEIQPVICPLSQTLYFRKKGRGRKRNELRKDREGKRGKGEGRQKEGKPGEPGEEMEEEEERWVPRWLHVKALACKPEPEFHSQGPHGGRRRRLPAYCPLISPCVPWQTHVHTHTHTDNN